MAPKENINTNTADVAKEIMPITGTDYIELYVSNALQAAYYYVSAFGFTLTAYAGLETGRKDMSSFVLTQGKIRLVLTSPLRSGTTIGQHIDRHGDGVKVIAMTVPDAARAYQDSIDRGATGVMPPKEEKDDHGSVVRSAIRTYGEVIHVFVTRDDYNGIFLPGYEKPKFAFPSQAVGFKYVDHIVGNVHKGEMNDWVDFYKKVMGFQQIISFDDKDISTDYTALMSKVMSNNNGRIKFPINEPADGLRKSQVEEYLEYYEGAGVQHIAMATDDIIYTIGELRRRGVQFLEVPATYYESLVDRVGEIEEDIEKIKELNILVDRDDEGYLLQIFTKPLNPRPTLFFEIIQRRGATSFGKGNFKALFEAIEREQSRRGTL